MIVSYLILSYLILSHLAHEGALRVLLKERGDQLVVHLSPEGAGRPGGAYEVHAGV